MVEWWNGGMVGNVDWIAGGRDPLALSHWTAEGEAVENCVEWDNGMMEWWNDGEWRINAV